MHPHSQERDHMNRLYQSDQAFTQVEVTVLLRSGQTRSSSHLNTANLNNVLLHTGGVWRLTLTRACSLSRIWSEERSPTLVELSRQYGQSVGGKRQKIK